MAIDVGTAVAYLDLNMTSFNEGIRTAESALQTFANDTATIGDKLTSIGGLISNIGTGLTQAVTIPLVKLGETAVQSAISFESAFTGVRKTVDATEQEYGLLADAIAKMATETASSAEEIAGVMEVAGQLGIELGYQGENITEFTKVMVQLGDSTNLTAEAAATMIARFANITGMAEKDVDRLGATLVDLGNNFAAQEDEIMLMATRLASAGTMAGLTEREILALATAMTSVGIRAEAGGSAMSTTLSNIEAIVKKAIGGDKGATAQLETLGMVAEMSAEQFADAWVNRPKEALTAFLIGMGKLEEKGESAVLVLDELGMSGVRQSNMLRALGLAGSELTRAIDMANKAWEENTALTIEAEKRYGTLESRISQLKEGWKAVARDIAEILIPYLEKLMDAVRKVIDWWNGLSESQQENIVKIGMFVAALGPLITIIGRITTSVGSMMNVFKLLGSAIGLANAPLAGIVAAIALAVTGFVKLYNESEEFRQRIQQLFERLSSMWQKIKPVVDFLLEVLGTTLLVVLEMAVNALEFFVDKIANAFDWFSRLIEAFRNGNWSEIGKLIVEGIWEGIKFAASLAFAPIKFLFDAIVNAIKAIFGIHSPAEAMIPFGENILLGILEGFKNMVGAFVEALKEFAQIVFDFFAGLWDGLTDFLSEVWSAVSGFISNVWNGLSDFVSNAWKAISDFFKNIWNGIVELVQNIWNKVTEFVQSIWDKVTGFISDVWNKVTEFFQNIWNRIVEFFQGIWERIVSGFEKIRDILFTLFDNIRETLSNLFGGLRELVEKLFDTVITVVTGLLEKLTAMIKGFIEIIWSVINEVKEFISTMIDTVKNLVTNIVDSVKSIVESFLSTIQELWNKISNAVRQLWESVSGFIKEKVDEIVSNVMELVPKMLQAGKDIITNFWDGIKSVWSNVSGWFEDKFGWIMDLVNNIKNGISDIVGWVGGKVSGLHAGGLDYVPYNGYIAELHEGERVLTKQEAQDYNNKNTTSSGGDTYNFYDVKNDPYEYARAIKRMKKEMLLD